MDFTGKTEIRVLKDKLTSGTVVYFPAEVVYSASDVFKEPHWFRKIGPFVMEVEDIGSEYEKALAQPILSVYEFHGVETEEPGT